ncbi:hypothetical protein B1808_14765, partial [Pseudofulvimonas gallinarii]
MSPVLIITAVILFAIAALAYLGPNRIIDGVEGLLAYIGKAAKQSLGDYIEIENVDLGDSQTFVMKDGSLMTMIR